jgi:hypothetical protein
MDIAKSPSADELASLLQSPLFRKGLAIPLSVQEDFARTGVLDLPTSDTPQERFLQDFVTRAADTAGTRFATWLQGKKMVDPTATRVRQATLLSGEDGSKEHPFLVKRGSTHSFDVVTCDSAGTPIHHASTKVAASVVCLNSDSSVPKPTGGPLLADLLENTSAKTDDRGNRYQCKYHSHNFSPEEARLQYLSSAPDAADSSVRVNMMTESEYSVAWTPARTGDFQLELLIEDVAVEDTTVHIKVGLACNCCYLVVLTVY